MWASRKTCPRDCTRPLVGVQTATAKWAETTTTQCEDYKLKEACFLVK